MAYNNVKVKARQVVSTNTQSEGLGNVSVVPMDFWNAITQYQKLNKVRYVSTGGSGVTLLAKKANQGIEPFVSQGWQDIWMVENYDGGSVIPNGTYPDMTVGNATDAQNDGTGTNIAEQFTNINEKIPSTASAENQLADKAFVNSSINNMAAFYITSNVAGDAFSTRASLLAAATFYSGGATRVPTQNDYAIVLADESQPKGVDGEYPTTRYSYQGGTYPNGQWDFQYVVNNTSLTQAQVDAINSGINSTLVGQITANKNNIETKASKDVATQTTNGLMSAADKTKLDGLGGSNVTGVKGNSESAYRTGNVNLTPANIGAVPISDISNQYNLVGVTGGERDQIILLATFPFGTAEAANYSSLSISGSIGGWEASNKRVINIVIANRDGFTIRGMSTKDWGNRFGFCYSSNGSGYNIYLRLMTDYAEYNLKITASQCTLAKTNMPTPYSSQSPIPLNISFTDFSNQIVASISLNSNTSQNITMVASVTSIESPSLLTVFGVETAQHGCIYISRDTNINSTWSDDNNNGSNILAKVEGEQGYWSCQYLCCSVLIPANATVYVYVRYLNKIRYTRQPIFAIT